MAGTAELSARDERRWLLVIAAFHFALTLAFVARVPLGHAPDETSHLEYVRHLVTKRALPVFGVEGVTYEAHQPPLYYVLCAPAFVAAQSFGQEGQIVACRLLSALLGLMNLIFIWLGAREVFRGDRVRPLLAAGFCAVLPMNLYVNSACGNDVLAGLFASATLWWLLRGCGRGFDERACAIAGALAGFALWSKMNALVFVPLGALTVWLWARRARLETPRAVRLSGLVVLVALLISAPWLLRNSWIYGDPLALRAFKQFFRNPSPGEMMQAFGLGPFSYALIVEFLTLVNLIGLGGDINSAILRLGVFDPVIRASRGIMAIRGAIGGLWTWILIPLILPWLLQRAPKFKRELALQVLALTMAAVLLLYVQFNLSYFQAQARYFHLTLLPIACAMAGLLNGRRMGIGLAGALLLALCVADLTLWQPILLPGGGVVTRSWW